MESRVLPAKAIARILDESFVCVKVNIDKPPAAAEKLLGQVGGDTLPFYAYVTPDGKFILGTSGYRDEREFAADLGNVLKHESLKTSTEAEKRLSAAVEQAAKDLEAKQYASVVKAWRNGASEKGFS